MIYANRLVDRTTSQVARAAAGRCSRSRSCVAERAVTRRRARVERSRAPRGRCRSRSAGGAGPSFVGGRRLLSAALVGPLASSAWWAIRGATNSGSRRLDVDGQRPRRARRQHGGGVGGRGGRRPSPSCCRSPTSPPGTAARRAVWPTPSSSAGSPCPGLVDRARRSCSGCCRHPSGAGLYQTLPVLIVAYVVHFGAQAMRAGAGRGRRRCPAASTTPPGCSARAGRGGSGPSSCRSCCPASPPARGLVLLSTMKELPATLLLAPIGFDTLATRIWSCGRGGLPRRGRAPSLVLVALSGVLTWVLVVRRVRRARLMAAPARPSGGPAGPRLGPLLVVVALVVAAGALAALPARATYGARTTADEPQYLLSALSLAEDRDLDIADELRAERWRDFHEVDAARTDRAARRRPRLEPARPAAAGRSSPCPSALGGWVGRQGRARRARRRARRGSSSWVAVRRFAVRRLWPRRDRRRLRRWRRRSRPTAPRSTPSCPPRWPSRSRSPPLTGPLGRRGRVVARARGRRAAVARGEVRAGRRRARRSSRWSAAARAATDGAAVVLVGGARRRRCRVPRRCTRCSTAAGPSTPPATTSSAASSPSSGVDPDYVGRSLPAGRPAPRPRLRPRRVGAGVPARRAGARRALARAPPAGLGCCWSSRSRPGGPTPPWSRSRCTAGGGRAARSSSSCRCVVLAVAWWVGRLPRPAPASSLAVAAVAGFVLWGWLVVEVLAAGSRSIVDFEATREPARPGVARAAARRPAARRRPDVGAPGRSGWSCLGLRGAAAGCALRPR